MRFVRRRPSVFDLSALDLSALMRALLFSAGLGLASCASVEQEAAAVEGEAAGSGVRILSPASVEVLRKSEREALSLPDLLYAGLQALDADRLLTPEETSAYSYFARALRLDSDNEIAREGMRAIVARYLQLAREAIGNGSFDAAELMIDRAGVVDPAAAEITLVRAELAKERESGDLFFRLDGGEVSAQSDAARRQLADIARQARDCEAFFLITAPTDATARWMFMAMRESVEGYRLRGNIELSSQTGVRLRLPEGDNGCSA